MSIRCGRVAVLALLSFTAPAPGDPQPSPGGPTPAGSPLRLGTSRLRHPAGLTALAFAPDGKTLASADAGGRVRLWDARTGELLRELPAGTGTFVAFSPDGGYLATAGRAGEAPLRVWSARDGSGDYQSRGRNRRTLGAIIRTCSVTRAA